MEGGDFKIGAGRGGVWSAWIHRADPFVASLEAGSKFAFVADRPHDDARMVAISGEHFAGELDDLRRVSQVV